VGPSGAGKTTAKDIAADALDVGEVIIRTPGSGEGIAHQYVRRSKDDLERTATAIMFVESEVDTLAGLISRQGSVLGSALRGAFDGGQLGYAFSDPTKRLVVEPHTYRLTLVVGVQPQRAAPLLEDDGAGTPQRFLWLPAEDPNAPDECPAEPEPLTWDDPTWMPSGVFNPAGPIPVCEQARKEIDDDRLIRLRGKAAETLDGHSLLTRLKIAAALGLLDGHLGVDDEDWRLAGELMRVSDDTRRSISIEMASTKRKLNRARAEAEADRNIIVGERVVDAALTRVSTRIVDKLTDIGDWVSHSDIRRFVAYRDREQWFEEALEHAVTTGQIDMREVVYQGHPGHQYRSLS
jgi:hypothetical protein